MAFSLLKALQQLSFVKISQETPLPNNSQGDHVHTAKLDKTTGAYCELNDLIRWKAAAKRINISKRKRALRRTAGPHRSPSRGRGMEFEDVRQYQAGDDIRHIDWRVSARVGKTHTKQFREEREIPILLVLDQRQNMFFGSQSSMKSVMACDIASLLAWAGLANGDRVGGIIFENQQHYEIRPKKSRASVLHFLKQCVIANNALTTHSLSTSTPTNTNTKPTNGDTYSTLNSILVEVKRLAKPGFQVFLISDFYDFNDNCQALLRDISLHCECTALQIFDPLEQEFSQHANISSQTIYTGNASVIIHPDNKQWQEDYQQGFNAHQLQLQQSFKKFRIPLISLSSNDEPASILQQHFSKR